ncbi:MAG: hypothetical protein R3F53_15525 [Gammaproteobacteria bacterium]
MSMNFSHPNGAQIMAAAQQNNKALNNVLRIAETASLSTTLKDLAKGLEQFTVILQLFDRTPVSNYRVAETSFMRAIYFARSGNERNSLESLANGLIGLSNAVAAKSTTGNAAANTAGNARQHFNEALRLARSGRQRPVLKEFALGLKDLAQALASVVNTVDNQWVRDLLQPQTRFTKAAELAGRGRQGPVLYWLASGLNSLTDVTLAGIKMFSDAA